MSENLNDQNAVLTGAKQTMTTWSKVIESYETVPAIYKSSFATQIADKTTSFPYTLLVPSLIKPRGKTTEKLICDNNNAIHILERNGNQVVTKSYPYQAVCTVEVGSILLSSWLTISGVNSAGTTSTSTIDFNTSSTHHFATFLKKLRPAPQGADEKKLKAEKDKFDTLSEIDFKFMNFGRSCLIQGETIHQILFQPEIRKSIWKVFGKLFYRVISPTHLTIVTNQEVIIIRDAERKNVRVHEYGGIWQYLPLRSITSTTLSEPVKDRITLSIRLSSGETIKKIFEASSQQKLEQLQNQIQALIGQVHTTA